VRALLDVNVWIALFDDAHQFSSRANAFVEAAGTRIATCPLVENGSSAC
jgi:predicted nucleic acid-binding protein